MTPEPSQAPLELQIPAVLQRVSMVRRLASEAAHQAGLGSEEASDLLLAVSEACNNAIQHGARGAPGAQISVRAYPSPGTACIEVSDPGVGFDPGDLWEPGSEVAHGRGMLLIMQLTDTVEYATNGRGTTVRLTKYSRAAEAPGPDGADDLVGGPAFANMRNSRLYALFDVCRAVSGSLELPEVLKIVAERTARLFGVARARVILYDPRRQTTTVAASWGERLKVNAPAPAPASRHAVYVAGQAATVQDAPSRGTAPETVRSAISVPIVSRGSVVGSIHLDNFQRQRRFTRSDALALRAIAAQAAAAIDNARLYREAHRHVEELAALGEVARALNASLDLDHILRTILEKTHELLGTETCAVMLLDEQGYLSVRASRGMSEEYVHHQRALLHESPLVRAISEQRVIAAWDLRAYDVPRGLHEGVVSAAAAPMIVHDRPIGTLNIYTRERYRFTEEQLHVLRALADHTALAIHNGRLYETSQQARAQLEASMERAGSAMDTTRDLHEIIRLVAELAAQALGTDGGAFIVTDLEILIGAGLPAAEANMDVVRGFEKLAQTLAEQAKPLTLAEVPGHPGARALVGAGIASCLMVPVAMQDGLDGALAVYSRGTREFGPRDTVLLSAFAAQASVVIENQRLLQDTGLRLEELGTLLEVAQSIVSKLDLDSVLDRIIQHVSRIMSAEVCSILLVERQTGELRVAASRGLDPRHAHLLRLPQGEGVIGTVLREGEPRAVRDIRRDSDFVYHEVDEGQGLRALLCVPLRTPSEVLGVVNVYRTTAHAWSDAEMKFLSALGTQAAIAIQNATLYQQEQRIAQALQKAFVPASPPEFQDLEVGQIYLPAGEPGEVGGDFYDFIPVDPGRLGIVIADVSGKGLRAATGTAMGKYTLRAYLLESPRPGEVLARANNALLRQLGEETSFLTLFYALWEPRTHHLTWANAGHPYPILYQRSLRRTLYLRSPETMLLGVMPDQTYSEERLLIRPGDVLVAYTDGITDARSGQEFFGMARVAEMLPNLADLPAQAIADAILQHVTAFRDDVWSDDMTIVAMKFG